MKSKVYRLRAWTKDGKKTKLHYEFDFESKDELYQKMKTELRSEGYRVQELFAWC